MAKSPRVLLFDIETSLQPVAVFSLANQDWINPENILAERHLVSVCWKWFGESKVYSVSLLNDPKRFAKDPHDDKHVCEVFHKVLNEADCVIGHNSDNFDIKYLKTRMLIHGMATLPPITSLDTYKVLKQNFMLNSNKLDYAGHVLGLGRKKSTPKGLWLDVLAGSKKAIKVMVDYNKRDVTLLEDVFKKLVPYIPNHVSRELFGGTGCPRCGSHKIQSRGLHRAISKVYQRFQCQSCSGWFREFKSSVKSPNKYRVL